MYREIPAIETPLQAIDELSDVQMTLNGLSTLTLALSKEAMSEPEVYELISCLLDYCALVAQRASETLKEQ